MGIRRAMALICDAKQIAGGGKSGPVETGPTGLAATALLYYLGLSVQGDVVH